MVEHPGTVLGFTIKNRYYHHNGTDWTTTSSPSANADISMQGFPYCNIYNLGDTYCMQVLKTDKSTIKSDSLPANALTIIGWYDSTVADTNSTEHSSNLYKEVWKQTKQKIGIKRM